LEYVTGTTSENVCEKLCKFYSEKRKLQDGAISTEVTTPKIVQLTMHWSMVLIVEFVLKKFESSRDPKGGSNFS